MFSELLRTSVLFSSARTPAPQTLEPFLASDQETLFKAKKKSKAMPGAQGTRRSPHHPHRGGPAGTPRLQGPLPSCRKGVRWSSSSHRLRTQRRWRPSTCRTPPQGLPVFVPSGGLFPLAVTGSAAMGPRRPPVQCHRGHAIRGQVTVSGRQGQGRGGRSPEPVPAQCVLEWLPAEDPHTPRPSERRLESHQGGRIPAGQD